MATIIGPNGFRFVDPKYIGGGEFWYENGILMVRCTIYTTAVRFCCSPSMEGDPTPLDHFTMTPADVDGLPDDAVFAPGSKMMTPPSGNCWLCIENNYFTASALPS